MHQINQPHTPQPGAVVVAPIVPGTATPTELVQPQNPVADFGPSGYDPASVDNFVLRAAAQIDALLVDNLRAQTELDSLRTRLCENTSPAGVPDGQLDDQFISAAHVIRTAIDTAERRARQLVQEAEQTAANVRTNAQRDAACSLQAAAAMADARRTEAQAACDRMLRKAHEQVTLLQTETAMRQLDAADDVQVLNSDDEKLRNRSAANADVVTIDSVDGERVDGFVADDPKRQRTFEALWHAGTDLEDADMDRYFQRSSNEKASF